MARNIGQIIKNLVLEFITGQLPHGTQCYNNPNPIKDNLFLKFQTLGPNRMLREDS